MVYAIDRFETFELHNNHNLKHKISIHLKVHPHFHDISKYGSTLQKYQRAITRNWKPKATSKLKILRSQF